MGSTSSRQGSAALSHVWGRAARRAIVLATALIVVLLAAAPAMASNVSVVDGQLRFGSAPGETNVVTITQTGADTFTVRL